jgi:DNA-binding IclR family transcriptional regulator
MSSIMQKTLRTLELLSYNPEGLGPREVADALDIPASGAHRLLNELVTLGYVRQEKDRGAYALTTRLISLGLESSTWPSPHLIAWRASPANL